jgi:diguanylate cyclase (GGDEF)-like protein
MGHQVGNGDRPHPQNAAPEAQPSAAEPTTAPPVVPHAEPTGAPIGTLFAAARIASPRAEPPVVSRPERPSRHPGSAGPGNPEDPALDGTLAAYLERVANRAAAAFSASAAVIALVGDDRRCFIGGSVPPVWLGRDPGALIRSRACVGVLESGEIVAVENASSAIGVSGGTVATMPGVPAYMIAPLPRASSGRPAGVFCVFAASPRQWSAEEIALLGEHAAATAPALALRRRPDAMERAGNRTRREWLQDSLTGLPNRVLFMERLAHAIARNRREAAPFAVILLDLDHFRTINESLGHGAGDAMLVAVGQRLIDCSRAGDTVARLGADEFALLVHRVTHAADAARLAERIQASLAAPIDVQGYEVFTSASFGIALESGSAGEPEHLLRSADLALGGAKRAGRSRFVVFDRVMHSEALARLQLETELRRAAEREAFVLHFQPIISLATGRIVSVEALVRWDHEERGLVAPAAFIAAAEATGVIVSVGRWVLMEACRQLHAWHVAFPQWSSLSVAVNVSVRQLLRPDFVDTVSRALREATLSPECLTLELTESVVIERPDVVLAALSTVRELGVRVHLDDFGTGYSSLAVLDRFPLDGVKIDRTFVQMLGREARAVQFVQAMVTLAQSLQLETVGEGVDSDDQLRELRAIGCTYGQGYLFARAGDVPAVEQLLRDDPRW